MDFTSAVNTTNNKGKFENKRSFKRGRDFGTFVEDLGKISRPNSPKTQLVPSPKVTPDAQDLTLKIPKKTLENSLEIIKKYSIPKHKVKAMRIFIGKKTKHKPNRFKNSILPPIIKKLSQKKSVITTNDTRNNKITRKEIEIRSVTPGLDYKPNSASCKFFRLRRESKETSADDSSNEERSTLLQSNLDVFYQGFYNQLKSANFLSKKRISRSRKRFGSQAIHQNSTPFLLSSKMKYTSAKVIAQPSPLMQSKRRNLNTPGSNSRVRGGISSKYLPSALPPLSANSGR